MMIPVSIALISDLFPAEKRGAMTGGLRFIQLLANILSPILGSVITKQLGWHRIFYITLVMIVVAMLLVARATQIAQVSQGIRWSEIELIGGLVFGVFCALTVSFSNAVSGQSKLGITGVLLLVGAITTAIILVWNESRHKDPIIKVAFLRRKSFVDRSLVRSLPVGSWTGWSPLAEFHHIVPHFVETTNSVRIRGTGLVRRGGIFNQSELAGVSCLRQPAQA